MAWSQQQLWKKMCHRLQKIRDILNCLFSIDLRKHLYSSCSFHSTRTCSIIYRRKMRIFPVTLYWCPFSNLPNLTPFTVLWENMGVYTFITNIQCHNNICRWMTTLLPGAITLMPGMPLWCFGEEEGTSSAAFFILLFAAISYALQSCSLMFLYTFFFT